MKRLLVLFVMLLVGCSNETDVVVNRYANTIGDLVICSGENRQQCLDLVARVEELLPQKLQKEMVDSSSFIEVYVGDRQEFLQRMRTEEIHIEEFEYEGVTGFGYRDKTVVYSMADEYTLIHELAHVHEYSYWYDGTYNDNPSASAEWQYAYEHEYISSYGTTSPMEFYAECFAMYFRNPSGLKMFCPLAYSLLQTELTQYVKE